LEHKIDWTLAHTCAELCDKAYVGPEKFKDYLFRRVIMHTELRYFDVDGAQAYGIAMPDFIMVVFRGTEPSELSDIVADIKAWQRDSDTVGEVHAGFQGELDKLYPQITAWISGFPKTKIVSTGHSLGAAMASLFAARMHRTNDNVALYTYGSPRAGDRTWAKQFIDIEAYRFVNTNDVVCTVPPFGFYSHVGKLYYLSYNGTIIEKSNFWIRLKDKIRGRLRAWQKRQLFSGVYDHNIRLYSKKLKL